MKTDSEQWFNAQWLKKHKLEWRLAVCDRFIASKYPSEHRFIDAPSLSRRDIIRHARRARAEAKRYGELPPVLEVAVIRWIGHEEVLYTFLEYAEWLNATRKRDLAKS